MKVLFTTIPGFAHLHPAIPIAKAVEAAGHEIAFAVAQSFCPLVENAGIKAFSAGIDWRAEAQEEAFPECKDFPPEDHAMFFIRRIVSRRCPPVMVDDILALAETWKPDLIVHDFWEFGGGLAAEILDIPHAAMAMSGGSIRLPEAVARDILVEPFDAIRARYGLAPDPDLAMLDRYLRLDLVPPTYEVPKEARSGSVYHRIRRESYDRTVVTEAPAWLDEMPYERTALITMGTVFNRDSELFRTIVEGLRDDELNLIVTVGNTQDPGILGDQPPHVRVARYIPYTLLFPRVDLLVAAGGATTVMSALIEAVPVLFVPESADHPVNADLFTKAGAALTLGRDAITRETIRTTARRILDEPSFATAAREVQTMMLAQPGPAYAAELLIRLARERRPILAA